jgi:hypothetical protein
MSTYDAPDDRAGSNNDPQEITAIAFHRVHRDLAIIRNVALRLLTSQLGHLRAEIPRRAR